MLIFQKSEKFYLPTLYSGYNELKQKFKFIVFWTILFRVKKNKKLENIEWKTLSNTVV